MIGACGTETVVDAAYLHARIEAVLQLVLPREAGYWRECIATIEPCPDRLGSNWMVKPFATPADTRIIAMAANLVRTAHPRLDQMQTAHPMPIG